MTVRQDLIIREGATFTFGFDAGFDLAGYSARATFKPLGRYINTPEAFLSSEGDADGGTIDLSGQVATLSMTPAQTSALVGDQNLFGPFRADEPLLVQMWDMVLTAPDGTATRPLEGRVYAYRSVTE